MAKYREHIAPYLQAVQEDKVNFFVQQYEQAAQMDKFFFYPDDATPWKYTLLHYAVRYNAVQIVTFLWIHYPDLRHKITSHGYTPLHLAVALCRIELVNFLLSGGEIHCLSPYRYLGYSIPNINVIEKYLADIQGRNVWVHRANPNAACLSNEMTPPLHIAIERRSHYVIDRLIREGANVNYIRTAEQGTTALHFLVESQREDMIHDFLNIYKAKVDIHSATTEGKTPFLRALERNDFTMASILRRAGANVNHICPTSEGMTALHLAVDREDIRMLNYLLFAPEKPMIDIQAWYNGGFTPLALAVYYNDFEMMQKLLKAGANPHFPMPYRSNATTFHIAACRPELDIDIIQALCNYDCVPHMPDLGNSYPIDYAKLYQAGAALSFFEEDALIRDLDPFAIVQHQPFKLVRKLLEDLPELDLRRWEKGAGTILHAAVLSGAPKKIKLIACEYKYLLDEPDKEGYLPLHIAVHMESLPAVRALLKCGATLNLPAHNQSRYTALQLAMAKTPKTESLQQILHILREEMKKIECYQTFLRHEPAPLPLLPTISENSFIASAKYSSSSEIEDSEEETGSSSAAEQEHTSSVYCSHSSPCLVRQPFINSVHEHLQRQENKLQAMWPIVGEDPLPPSAEEKSHNKEDPKEDTALPSKVEKEEKSDKTELQDLTWVGYVLKTSQTMNSLSLLTRDFTGEDERLYSERFRKSKVTSAVETNAKGIA